MNIFSIRHDKYCIIFYIIYDLLKTVGGVAFAALVGVYLVFAKAAVPQKLNTHPLKGSLILDLFRLSQVYYDHVR
ncbi:hypothetical protein EBQ81_03205 [bacterium]|nr:hypothetical protein [bacterium]